ncbi:MAG: hypothetical protein KatS3mg118_2500 [Paracoccaceae bacterium]|nr:MAG: hypothetical protein KatS3mg118_2500 [Paracoccaceae bacterium]
MTGPIVVINPNSNPAVTDGLSAAVEPFRAAVPVECVTLEEGPFGIESQRDVDQVALPLAAMIERRPDAAAFVIACYSDPGIDLCRATAKVPVFGIQESGVLSALALGDRFGVLAIAEASIRRHIRYLRRMGVEGRLAGERALNMTVDESARSGDALARLTEVGRALIADGADVLILGCTGMSRHRAALQGALGRPVVDPTQAAVAMAMGVVLA